MSEKQQFFPVQTPDGKVHGVGVRITDEGYLVQTTVENPWVPVTPGHGLYHALQTSESEDGKTIKTLTKALHADILELLYQPTETPPQPEPVWTIWAGFGTTPLQSDTVEVRLRNGTRLTTTPGMVYWHHNDNEGDIVAYRVLPS